MKLYITTILILLFAFTVSAQNKKPVAKPTPTPTTATTATTTEKPAETPAVDDNKATVEAFSLYTEILTLRLKQAVCGYNPKEEGCDTVGDKLADDYAKAVKNPKVMNYLIAEATGKYDQLREQTKSAPQVSQIADEQNALLMRLIVVQNQRIIELLEQIAKKK